MPNLADAGVVVFLLSTGFVIYVVVGYPLLLALLRRWCAKPVRRGPVERPISIILAVYNGGAFLEAKLRSLLAVRYPRNLMQILVVSDGSTDSTDQIAQSMEAEGVRLIQMPRGGKALALNAGMAAATGEFLVFTDVRQTVDPDAVPRLLEHFADLSVGVVSGALTIVNSSTREEVSTGLYWRYEFWIRDNLAALDSIFGATGALYAMRRELTQPIPRGTLLDDMYLPLAAFFRGYRLTVEREARMYDFPTAANTEFRRKVRTLAGNYQILAAYPGLLGLSNRLWIHYVSYKFARLLLPFALLVVFASSWALPPVWREAALAGQTLGYGLAAIDRLIADRSPLKRITSPLATFMTLMLAGFFALSVFFVRSERLWVETKVSRSATQDS